MYIMGCEQAGNRRSSLLNRRYQLSQPKVCSTTDLFFSKTKPWVCCSRKTTWIIHPKLSITDLRNRWPLSPRSTSDQIQPWNPLSHLVDRKREPVCSLHVQEHLLLWPPQHACRSYQPQCSVLDLQVHEGFVKPDPLMNHRCSDNCWNLVFGGWRIQDR